MFYKEYFIVVVEKIIGIIKFMGMKVFFFERIKILSFWNFEVICI